MQPRTLFFTWTAVFILACGAAAVAPGANSPTETEPTPGVEGSVRSSQVDSLMAGYSDSPGGAVMVIQDGEIVHQKGYGFADVENSTPITTESVFHLGSVGKQFTAMGIMMLKEQGLVEYDEPVSTYLPELEWMGEGVTVRRLLHHTSGMRGEAGEGEGEGGVRSGSHEA